MPRLWQRHILNSAAVAEAVPEGARVVDVGSGAGLPGIPLGLARPDLDLTLVEPMARRVEFLEEVVAELAVPAGLRWRVVRGRAEERSVATAVGPVDVVTARAVAPLPRLVGWCRGLMRPGTQLVALVGAPARSRSCRPWCPNWRPPGCGTSIRGLSVRGSGTLPLPWWS